MLHWRARFAGVETVLSQNRPHLLAIGCIGVPDSRALKPKFDQVPVWPWNVALACPIRGR